MASICSTCKHYKGEVNKNKITFDGVEDGEMFFKDITSKLDLVYCDKNICGIPVAQSALTLTQCPHWEVCGG